MASESAIYWNIYIKFHDTQKTIVNSNRLSSYLASHIKSIVS